MGTCRIAWPYLDGRETHECLIAKRRRTERLLTHQDRPPHERMIQIRAGGTKAETAGFDLAMNLFLNQLETIVRSYRIRWYGCPR